MSNKLYITEYAGTGDVVGQGNIAAEPEITTQVVTYSTHTESSALNNNTSIVRLHTDGICSVAFGTAPTATTSNRRMVAGQTEYFKVPTGKAYIISAVSNT